MLSRMWSQIAEIFHWLTHWYLFYLLDQGKGIHEAQCVCLFVVIQIWAQSFDWAFCAVSRQYKIALSVSSLNLPSSVKAWEWLEVKPKQILVLVGPSLAVWDRKKKCLAVGLGCFAELVIACVTWFLAWLIVCGGVCFTFLCLHDSGIIPWGKNPNCNLEIAQFT